MDKYYARVNDKGKIVRGSLIFKGKKPATGKWVEILYHDCCTQLGDSIVPITFSEDYAPPDYDAFLILSNAESYEDLKADWVASGNNPLLMKYFYETVDIQDIDAIPFDPATYVFNFNTNTDLAKQGNIELSYDAVSDIVSVVNSKLPIGYRLFVKVNNLGDFAIFS